MTHVHWNTTINISCFRGPAGQHGVALIFGLVILLVLTIFGIAALRTSSLEQLMSGNTQEQARAFQAADSGTAKCMNKMPIDVDTFDAVNTCPFSAMGTSITPSVAKIQKAQEVASDSPSGESCFTYTNLRVAGTTAITNARTALNQGFKHGSPVDKYDPTPCQL